VVVGVAMMIVVDRVMASSLLNAFQRGVLAKMIIVDHVVVIVVMDVRVKIASMLLQVVVWKRMITRLLLLLLFIDNFLRRCQTHFDRSNAILQGNRQFPHTCLVMHIHGS